MEKAISTLLITYILILNLNDYKKYPRKTSAYVKSYDGKTKWVHFLIENDDFSGKYKRILDKVKTDIKKKKKKK